MEVLVAASSGAIAGLISGVIGSLIAPWVQWAIEKRRSRLSYRQQLINTWREGIDRFDFQLELAGSFGETDWYSAIRPHLRDNVIEALERPRTAIVVNEGRGDSARKQMLLDEVTRIEKEWRLV
jgi:hypothetical protein